MLLYATALRGTAAVVGQRSNVDDLDDLDTSTMHGTDSRLTAIAGTLHISLNLAQTQVESDLGTILGSHLGSIRSVLLRTTEAHLTCRRPRDYLTLVVGERHNDVIKRAVYVELTQCGYLHVTLLGSDCFLCHNFKL